MNTNTDIMKLLMTDSVVDTQIVMMKVRITIRGIQMETNMLHLLKRCLGTNLGITLETLVETLAWVAVAVVANLPLKMEKPSLEGGNRIIQILIKTILTI